MESHRVESPCVQQCQTHQDESQNTNDPKPSAPTRSFSEPFTHGYHLPNAAEMPPEQLPTAKEKSAMEASADNAKAELGDAGNADDASSVIAVYDNEKGWIHNPEYFKELVRDSTDFKTLAELDPRRRYNPSSDVQALGTGSLMLCNVINNGVGYAKTLRVLTGMISQRKKSELRLELASTLEEDTTSQEQLARIDLLLKDLAEGLVLLA